MYKKTAFFAGIALMVQAVSMVVLFFLLFAKKKNLASVLLAMSAASGVAGGFLLYKHASDMKKESDIIDEFISEEDQFSEDNNDELEILTDDNVDEAEFK